MKVKPADGKSTSSSTADGKPEAGSTKTTDAAGSERVEKNPCKPCQWRNREL